MNALFVFLGLAAAGAAVWYFLLRKQETNNNTITPTPNIDTGNSDTTVDTNGSSGNNGEPGWSK